MEDLPLLRLGPAGEASHCIDLPALGRRHGFDALKLPRSLTILLENLAAHGTFSDTAAAAFSDWLAGSNRQAEIQFQPTRILMQDTAGVAALVDLAALRDSIAETGGDPTSVDFPVPTDLVIDHSLSVDTSGRPDAAAINMRREMSRNGERYRFFRWAQGAFAGLNVVPPGNGICHQVNLEHLSRVVIASGRAPGLAISELLIGTDSHTTMINALGVLGWGVGGIEAETVAFGSPLTMSLPPVTGCRLTGRRPEGTTATDCVLMLTNRLRTLGVVDHFVEFFGDGLDGLSVPDRAAIANMAPEYGATCGFFPIDQKTLDYLSVTGREREQINLIENHARATGLWRDDSQARCYSSVVVIDLGEVQPVLAGPFRPQDIVTLANVPASFRAAFPKGAPQGGVEALGDGVVALAAITSCTNTANPDLMIAAGLLARNARRAGLGAKPWVKTSLAPGSRIVADYLSETGLQSDLDHLGFNLVGFGCTTCVGNSGPLSADVADRVQNHGLVACAVLSGNRNFESRIHPEVRASYLASPPLVVAYALAGSILIDFAHDALGLGADGRPVYLRDIWPSDADVGGLVGKSVNAKQYHRRYDKAAMQTAAWNSVEVPTGTQFPWSPASTFIRRPPFFDRPRGAELTDIDDARALLVLGDSVTTDHISPISRIEKDTPAAVYLARHGVAPADWGSYGDRRGNHEVMWRGTFAHSRLRNALAGGKLGGFTWSEGTNTPISVFDAASELVRRGKPALIFGGREYGTGSARDWAAKGTLLLGVRAVIAESFERIHRANLVGVGVIPLQLPSGSSVSELALTGREAISIAMSALRHPKGSVDMHIKRADGKTDTIPVVCRLDTATEIATAIGGGVFFQRV